MLNVFLLFANTFLRLLLFLAALIPQLLQKSLKTHNAGHVPHTSKFAPWEIHSAIAVQTEEQASELEKYFKSHSGREWVIKHLGLPMGMTSLS